MVGPPSDKSLHYAQLHQVVNMSPKISICLIGYGALLLTLSLLGQGLQLSLTKTAMFAGTVGGILCMLWGALARLGHSFRGWTILTLGAISYTLLAQGVVAWLEPTEQGSGTYWVPAFKTVLFFGALALITYLLHVDQSTGKTTPRDA
jgi:hypothetical protein